MDCLIKRINGAANNENLPKYGYIKGFVPAGTTFDRFCKASAEMTGNAPHVEMTTFDDCVVVYDNGTVKSGTFVVDNWQSKIKNNSNSKISYYEIYVYNSTDIGGMFDDISTFPASSTVIGMCFYRYHDYATKGSIKDIGKKFPNLQKILNEYNESFVYGDLDEFSDSKLIRSIYLTGTAGITGSINSLATKLVAKGRNSGTLEIKCNGVIKYNDAAVANGTIKTIKFGTSMSNPTQEETARGWQIV